MLVAEPIDGPRDERRLVMLVVADVADDPSPVARVGPEVLGPPVRVAGDDRVGRPQDRLGRAVVLLQQDGPRVGVVLLKLHDVADRRPTEGIDRLVCVTDDDELSRRDRVCRPLTTCARLTARARTAFSCIVARDADELTDKLVLRCVGVLILIDQHMPKPPPIVLSDIGEGLQQVHGRHDEVVEVQGVGLAQPSLIGDIGLGHACARGGCPRRRSPDGCRSPRR
jgi:hypothetical protein